MDMREYLDNNPAVREAYDRLIYNPDYEDAEPFSDERNRPGLTNSGNKDSDRRSIASDIFDLGFKAGQDAGSGKPRRLTDAEKILSKPTKKR